METNKRFDKRHTTLGLMSSVSDGTHSFMGVVEDISSTGLRLSQVPAVFDDSVDNCYLVVKGPMRDFKVLLRPCWTRSTNRGMYKDIGFHIESPSQSWQTLVNRLTDESDQLHTLVSTHDLEM